MQRAEITVVERCQAVSHRALDRLDALFGRADYAAGLGVFFYGVAKESVLYGDRWVTTPRSKSDPALPLTDDNTRRNIVLQGLSNLAPAMSQRLQPVILRKGKRFYASPYGFTYYQRSYERAYEILAGSTWWARVLRGMGVDPRLTVCHQTWVIPVGRARDFLDFYFEALLASRNAAARVELQDIIRLPPSPWPLHGAAGMPEGCYLLSVSFSVRRDRRSFDDVRAFLGAVSQGAFERFGARVLLLKQTHCDAGVLRRMHADSLAELEKLRAAADPGRVLTSQWLEALAGA